MRLSSRSTSLDHRLERLSAAGESGCRSASCADARRLARDSEVVGHAGRHLAHRCQLLLLHEPGLRRLELGHLGREFRVEMHLVRARLPEVLRHLAETAGQVADLVARSRGDRMVEVAAADHRHGLAQLADRARQAARDERRPAKPATTESSRIQKSSVRSVFDDLRDPAERPRNAELARAPVIWWFISVSAGSSRPLSCPLASVYASARLPEVFEREDAVCYRADLDLDAPHATREFLFVGLQLRGPAVEPVVHHLAAEPELLARARLHAAERAPDHLALVEHRGLDLGVGPGPCQALAQVLQGAAFQRVAADRLGAHQQHREDHEPEAEKEFLLERHWERSTDGDAGMGQI